MHLLMYALELCRMCVLFTYFDEETGLQELRSSSKLTKIINPGTRFGIQALVTPEHVLLTSLLQWLDLATQVETRANLNTWSPDLCCVFSTSAQASISLKVDSWNHRVVQDPTVRKMFHKGHLLYQKFRIFSHIFNFTWENLWLFVESLECFS